MRRAWIALGLLAVFGIGGGVAVYLTGSSLIASDRDAIVAWERSAATIVVEPLVWLDLLPPLARAHRSERARADLGAAEASFGEATVALAAIETRSIMERTRDELRAFLERGAAAISLLTASEEPDVAAFGAALADARELYMHAREILIRLRCRARIEGCERTLLPAPPTVS